MKRPVWTQRRLERITLLLTALFVALTLLWFLIPRGDPAAPAAVTAKYLISWSFRSSVRTASGKIMSAPAS